MKLNKNSKTVNDSEEHMMKELKKKSKQLMWIEYSEENADFKKTNGHSRRDKNSEVKRNRHINKNDICNSHDETNRSYESSED